MAYAYTIKWKPNILSQQDPDILFQQNWFLGILANEKIVASVFTVSLIINSDTFHDMCTVGMH